MFIVTHVYTHRHLQSQTFTHTFFKTHRRLHTQSLRLTDVYTHRRLHTQTFAHTDDFCTHRRLPTQTFAFTDVCTHRRLHSQAASGLASVAVPCVLPVVKGDQWAAADGLVEGQSLCGLHNLLSHINSILMNPLYSITSFLP